MGDRLAVCTRAETVVQLLDRPHYQGLERQRQASPGGQCRTFSNMCRTTQAYVFWLKLQLPTVSSLQVVELVGPIFCLSWCKRKQWLLVGGKAQLHVYNACTELPNSCCTCEHAYPYIHTGCASPSLQDMTHLNGYTSCLHAESSSETVVLAHTPASLSLSQGVQPSCCRLVQVDAAAAGRAAVQRRASPVTEATTLPGVSPLFAAIGDDGNKVLVEAIPPLQVGYLACTLLFLARS